MNYNFYGADGTYNTIDRFGLTPNDYYDILSEVWCEYSCAPRLRDGWSIDDKTRGQCSITSFLMQDIYGGDVRGILRPGGTYHLFNEVGGVIFDLTSEQFHGEILDYSNCPLQLREDHFLKKEKFERYLYLKDALERRREIFLDV